MSSKKKAATHETESLKPLKVGSRVRCTDDGVEGRLVWANATAVKIRWQDGEQVTWRRDSLADRPIEILDPTDEPASLPDEPVQAPAPEPPTEQTPVEVTTLDQPSTTETPADEASAQADGETTQPAAKQPEAAEPAKETKKRKEPKAKAEGTEKKLSALDAAAKVLAEASASMNCQELIEAMVSKSYWSSPAGKTPHATLYSALLRELQTKGEQARFVKAERGKFALRDHGVLQ